MKDFDVIVVGAGPGGCVAAQQVARAGLRVGLFDQSSFDDMGKTIVVDVERSIFGAAEVAEPRRSEIAFQQNVTRILSKRERQAFALEAEHLTFSLFLDKLVKRLVCGAQECGVEFFDSHRAADVLMGQGRVCGVKFQHGESSEDAQAGLVIDATGFDAALLRRLDPDLGMCFRDREEDHVVAGTHMHGIDLDKARAAIASGRHGDEEVWVRLGKNGNYSTVYSYLSTSDLKAYLLIGHRVKSGLPSLAELMASFKDSQGYYGEFQYGGTGPIRVRRSLDRLVTHGFMVIGEAACQVIPTNGSGVASAMWAGHLAGRTAILALAAENASTTALWPYAWQYQTGRGAVLAGFDAHTRILKTLDNDLLADLVESGVMQAEDVLQSAALQPISISLKSLPNRLNGFLRHPRLIPALARMGLGSSKMTKHFQAYPKAYDKALFQAWQQACPGGTD